MKVEQIITEKIIQELENNSVPWSPQYSKFGQENVNFISKKPYQGINRLLLWMAGFQNPYFLTFKQANQLGGKIKKGEKASMVIFFKFYERIKDNLEIENIPVVRYYNVFNITQTEGIDYQKELDTYKTYNIKDCEDIIKDFEGCPDIKHNEQQAYYSPDFDYINMPQKNTFFKPESYYHTLFHELIHSTGHEKRLNRFKNQKDKLNSSLEKYSLEELVAEIGSTFLSKHSNISEKDYWENSVSYIKGWIKHLRNNPKHIIYAAARAEKAKNYILNIK